MGKGAAIICLLLAIVGAMGFAAILVASIPPASMRVSVVPVAVSDQLAPEAAEYSETTLGGDIGAGSAYVFVKLRPAQYKTGILINQTGTNALVWRPGGYRWPHPQAPYVALHVADLS